MPLPPPIPSPAPPSAGDLPQPAATDLEIKGVLDRSAAAWSAGDLDAFMACYEDSPETLYLTATQVVSGYESIRTMYAQRFGAGDAGSMGALTMKLLRVSHLGPRHGLAVGRYSLEREERHGGSSTGLFSLVLHDAGQGWRICADHTS